MFICIGGQEVLLASGVSTQTRDQPRSGRRLQEGCGGEERAFGERALTALIRLPRLPGPLPDYLNALRISLPLKSLTAAPSLYRSGRETQRGAAAELGSTAEAGLEPRASPSCVCCASCMGQSSSLGSFSTSSLPGLQDILVHIFVPSDLFACWSICLSQGSSTL